MRIRIANGRLIDPANQLDATSDLYIADGLITGVGKAPRVLPPIERSTPRASWYAGPGGPCRAPARAGFRVPRHPRIGNGGRDGRRRDQPGNPARHRPGARRTRPRRDALLPRQKLNRAHVLPGRRPHHRAQGRTLVRNGRAGRSRLRGLQPGQYADHRQHRADESDAVCRHLRLSRVDAAGGAIPRARRRRPRWRSRRTARPCGDSNRGGDDRPSPTSNWPASPARNCTSPACPAPKA